MRLIVVEELRMKGESWIIYSERGEVVERRLPRLSDLGLAKGKGVDSAVPSS